MSTFAVKPWNDPWTRAAMKDPAYKVYCWGHHDASRMSWRRLKRLADKDARHTRLGRAERRILNAPERDSRIK